MANTRIFYATQKAGIAPLGSTTYTTLRGLQTLGMTTTFNLEQVFEIGQIGIYENVEGVPDVEISLEKVLDGYAPLYTLATQLATSASLVGRSKASCQLAVSIYPDTNDQAEGAPGAEVQMSGLFVSSVGYSVSVDGNATETMSLVGNHKVWVGLIAGTSNATYANTTPFTDNDNPLSITGSGGVNRREDVLFEYSTDANATEGCASAASGQGTVLPQDIYGISASGTNDRDGNLQYGAHVQNFSSTVDLGREDLFELGRRTAYSKFVNFPIEVTTEIGVISTSGDLVSVTEEGLFSDPPCGGSNLTDRAIRLHMCEGLNLDLGCKNKLSTVGVTGGDAGGGNVEVTYTYSNFNDFSVFHPSDPNWGNASFTPGYLVGA